MQQIRIGNIVMANSYDEVIGILARDGFESICLNFTSGAENIEKFFHRAEEVKAQLQMYGIYLSSVAYYGNPIQNREEAGYMDRLVDLAVALGCDTVAGFTGALEGKPMDTSIAPYVEVFRPIAQHAQDKGVRIAFENCPMGGNWRSAACNIAINPDIWDIMFSELPAENIGLQWETAHQLEQLIDPYPQIHKYAKKMFLLHGKDANIDNEVIARHGISSPVAFCAHRFPGYGDCDWGKIISLLRSNGFSGCIDIEGWHDPVYNGELEYTGQLYALNYLKNCRDAGPFARQIR